ncbi:unnamed protein product [Lampetra planeri]
MGRVVASKGRGISLRATRPDRWRAAAIVAAGGGGGGGGQRSCGEAPREARESCQAAWDVAPATAEGGGSCSLLRLAHQKLVFETGFTSEWTRSLGAVTLVGHEQSHGRHAPVRWSHWIPGRHRRHRARRVEWRFRHSRADDAAGIVRTMRRLRHAPSHSPAATHPPDCPIAHCGVTAPRAVPKPIAVLNARRTQCRSRAVRSRVAGAVPSGALGQRVLAWIIHALPVTQETTRHRQGRRDAANRSRYETQNREAHKRRTTIAVSGPWEARSGDAHAGPR